MGTSQSSKGPNGKSPLIPSWADDEPSKAIPEPQARRHAPFREALGKAVSNGKKSDYKSALRHYARSSSGGGKTASRRLGSATSAGAQLFGLLTGSFVSSGNTSFNLSTLNGMSCDEAIGRITEALQTHDGDSEKIRNAMNEALSEALQGTEVFDEQNITDDVIINTMICYLTQMVFEQIMMDSSKAFNKAETAVQAVKAENQLLELIKVVVDEKMTANISNNIQTFSSEQMKGIQRQTIVDVWETWESYND